MKCSLLTLSTFIDKELDARKTGEVEAHLVACERCTRGVTHLREEAGRVGALAQVHVAEHSARSLMEQVGLIETGQTLPMRTNASVTVIPEDTPPWLGPEKGAALPWRARMGSALPAPGPVDPPFLPTTADAEEITGDADGLELPPAESGSTWNDISGDTTQEPTPPESVEAPVHLELPAPPEATESLEPAAITPVPPVASVPWFPPGTSPESLVADPHMPLVSISRSQSDPPAPSGLPEVASESQIEDVFEPVAAATPPIEDVVDAPEEEIAVEPVAEAAPVTEIESPFEFVTPEIAEQGEPEVPTTFSSYPEGADDSAVAEHEVPAAFHNPEPVVDHDVEDHDYHEIEATAQTWEPPVPPMAAPSKGLVAKIREAIAVRRAVRKVGDDNLAEIVSGEGAPSIEGSSRRHVARARDQVEQDRRLQSAAAAAAPETSEAIRDQLDIHPQSIATPPVVDTPAPVASPVASEDEVSLSELRAQALGSPKRSRPNLPSLPNVGGVVAAVSGRISPFFSTVGSRINLKLLGLGLVVVIAVGLGIATGKTSKPSVATSPSAHNSNVPTTSHNTSQPQTQPPATSTQGTPTQLTNVQTVGSGGTGFSIGDVRYGQHPGDFRVVFDLTGGSGTPTTVIGFKDATTLDVVFSGTAPSDATGVLPNTTTITKVTILPRTTQGQTVYQFTLAHGVTVKPSFGSGPTRLILDLT